MIALAARASARTTKPEAAEAAARRGDEQVTVRAKPEKRKNARERAREKYAAKGGTKPTTATAKPTAAAKPDGKAKAKKAKPGGKAA
ncbi:MAG TPA: hypothetical protein VFB31_06620 [Pseudolabrys sp.]|nr:hypothetical protein [Pseudolabrys sp.]